MYATTVFHNPTQSVKPAASVRSHATHIPSLAHAAQHIRSLPIVQRDRGSKADRYIWQMVDAQLHTSWPTRWAMVNGGARAVESAETTGVDF